MTGLEPINALAVGSPANFNIFDTRGKRTGSCLAVRLIEA